MSPSNSEPVEKYEITPNKLVELRQWAYAQTSERSTAEIRLKQAQQILDWVLVMDERHKSDAG